MGEEVGNFGKSAFAGNNRSTGGWVGLNLRRGTFASECEEFKRSERQTRTDGRTPLQRAARVAQNVRVSLGGKKEQSCGGGGGLGLLRV